MISECHTYDSPPEPGCANNLCHIGGASQRCECQEETENGEAQKYEKHLVPPNSLGQYPKETGMHRLDPAGRCTLRRPSRAGGSGRTTGPNLHFEVRYDNHAYNPLSYLAPPGPSPIESFARNGPS